MKIKPLIKEIGTIIVYAYNRLSVRNKSDNKIDYIIKNQLLINYITDRSTGFLFDVKMLQLYKNSRYN